MGANRVAIIKRRHGELTSDSPEDCPQSKAQCGFAKMNRHYLSCFCALCPQEVSSSIWKLAP